MHVPSRRALRDKVYIPPSLWYNYGNKENDDPEESEDDIYVEGKVSYRYLLEDLVIALHNLQAANPTIYDFGKYCFYPIMCLE